MLKSNLRKVDWLTEIERNILEFPYVVETISPPRIAFGSCRRRFPKKSPIRKKVLLDVSETVRRSVRTEIAENKRDKHDTTSVFGSRVSRFHLPVFKPQTVQPNTDFYDIPPTKSRIQSSYPLSSKVPRWPAKIIHTPAPSDYYCKQRRSTELSVSMGFGKQRLIIPEVAVFCGSENTSKCHKCFCKPIGDYFHNFELRLEMCRECMKAELARLKSCKFNNYKHTRALLALGKYKPARWCDFFHRHYGNLISEKFSRQMLRRKINLENHVSIYHKISKWYATY